jgi:hypothetical protein
LLATASPTVIEELQHCFNMADQENASGTNSQQQAPAPVVIRQGGNGLGTVVAALIIAGAAIYAINVWSTTKKETAPGKNLEQGIERLKEAAGQAMESRQ